MYNTGHTHMYMTSCTAKTVTAGSGGQTAPPNITAKLYDT